MSERDSSEEGSLDANTALASFQHDAPRPEKQKVVHSPPGQLFVAEGEESSPPSNRLGFEDGMDIDDVDKKDADEEDLAVVSSAFVGVVIPPFKGKGVYHDDPDEMVVRRVLDEVDDIDGGLSYNIRFAYGREQMVIFDNLLKLTNGRAALHRFQADEPESDDSEMAQPRQTRKSTMREGYVDWVDVEFSDGEGPSSRFAGRHTSKRRRVTGNQRRHRDDSSESDGIHYPVSEDETEGSPSNVDEDDYGRPRRSKRKIRKVQKKTTRNGNITRRSERYSLRRKDSDDEGEDGSNNAFNLLRSDVLLSKKRKGRCNDGPTRRSGRANRHQEDMQKIDVEDIYRDDSGNEKAAPKVQVTKEIYQDLPTTNEFRKRHCQYCDSCGLPGGQLIFCQGCVLAYHPQCIGHRTGREHIVSKVAPDNFVLQCRRCVNVARKKDHTAPDHGQCQICKETGPACAPFRERKSTQQEQKERQENFGDDPIIDVDTKLINNVDCVLFRCTHCWLAFHFHHLTPRNAVQMSVDAQDVYELAQTRFYEYSRDFKCQDCSTMPAKVSGMIAWRPIDPDTYVQGIGASEMYQEELEYLVKWEKLSYFRAKWMPGGWTWGVTAPAMRRAFTTKDTGPKMRTEDAIPEDFLRIDIVLSVKYTNYVDVQTEQVDIARMKEVDKALIKYKGLPYEEAVWETVPTTEDGERWDDFKTAYKDWVVGRYIRIPKSGPLRGRLEKARAQQFIKLELKKQPPNFGDLEKDMKMMDYQLEGLNWIYYRWHQQANGILADEMGLGKTIQIIGFLAHMVHEYHCWPFLVVVPNSTCPNWRREIQKWAPNLKVVTYYGTAAARMLSKEYELYPDKSKDLKAHIVVTSYDAVSDDDARAPLRGVPWQGLIVDEGQRLKNDSGRLYTALKSFKIAFRILMTGTPLQNNARELFNLLQFLDDQNHAGSLDAHFEDLTNERIKELHELIRPYILRRTKVQALSDILPPLGHVIVPITMSFLQKKVCKSILAQKPELLKTLVNRQTVHKNDRANLNNVLMQLRKVLCHPFVYNQEIEERNESSIVLHRNLVEASAKLQWLEMILPKLKERGHRCLIFSQFLDMLSIAEDFLDGLGLLHRRLDGTISAMEKQKRIDQFNAPDSPYFAFLLSTRAGGVGINLATADTVILLDPDFNPHQDLQAISRAHRIGQTHKVVCFQMMTRASPEEKILSIGRKKMALEHVIVGTLDADDLEDRDVASILRHGAAELFSDEKNEEVEIKYDDTAIEKLLDRSMIESTKTGANQSADTQFSFARVWENDGLQDTLDDKSDDEPDPTVWTKILSERERMAAEEARAREQLLGRGRRTKAVVDYSGGNHLDAEVVGDKDLPPIKKRNRRMRDADSADSDTDFQDEGAEEEESEEEPTVPLQPGELVERFVADPKGGLAFAGATAEPDTGPDVRAFPGAAPPSVLKSQAQELSGGNGRVKYGSNSAPFKRVRVPKARLLAPPIPDPTNPHKPLPKQRACPACSQVHAVGSCPLKVAGVEHCPLCGLAHYGQGRTCPHINSETQVREMIACLQMSNEDQELVDAAIKYLRGVKGHLVQRKKKERENKMGIAVPGRDGAANQARQTAHHAVSGQVISNNPAVARGLQAANMLINQAQHGGLGGLNALPYSYQPQSTQQGSRPPQSRPQTMEERLANAMQGVGYQ
ncbi:hypothetical protein P152DRAFT_28751 [Eremomyces bilateralis CBS 781.70]|uniref:Uncharacterized protein n=1 Tax=Eremomyces bilateralis CBS 781.70 TaxID=1392243 RepID=A0A6G1G292_9PEZI|nr:uncharacterized protein P152DRAFT_28751 [Eremomyces bilateralis CBS 781.70]KAF1812225.1 hypothetical protein P152DRAFT_28751 [Eremomyces bilateralis CBS 781.70]